MTDQGKKVFTEEEVRAEKAAELRRLVKQLKRIPITREVDGDRSWDSYTTARSAEAFREDALARLRGRIAKL